MKLLIYLSVLFIFFSCKSKPSDSDIINASKEFIKERLVAPATAVFPNNDKIKVVRDKGDSTFRVSSFVDSENSFSANIRTEWEIHIWYIGGGFSDIKSWVPLIE